MRKTVLFLLLILAVFGSISAAGTTATSDWYIISGLALVASALVLIAIYMAGFALESHEMKFLATEEFYQWIATLLMVGTLVGAVSFFNSFSESIGSELGYGGKTVQVVANESLTNNYNMLSEINLNIVSLANSIGKESSKSGFCTLQGVGFSLAGCGAFRLVSTPLSLGENAVAVGFAELEALRLLLGIGATLSTTILLPAGIFLRVFKFTRAAGGFLIAIAITLYLVVPLGLVSMDMVIKKFVSAPGGSQYKWPPSQAVPSVSGCDPWEVKSNANINNSIGLFKNLQGLMDSYIFQILIRITLSAIVAIMVMATSIRYLSALAGAEVDVTALAKIA